MPLFVARQMSNGRWFVFQEGTDVPEITQDPSFAMGLSEERAHELARHASHKAARACGGQMPMHEPTHAAA